MREGGREREGRERERERGDRYSITALVILLTL